MSAVSRNHKALLAVATVEEHSVRLSIRTANGLLRIPSDGNSLPLRMVPPNISGLCNATFFAKSGRETRNSVMVKLPGESTVEDVEMGAARQSDQKRLPATDTEDHAEIDSQRVSNDDDEEAVDDSADEDSDDATEEPDSNDAGNDESAMDVLRRRESPEVERKARQLKATHFAKREQAAHHRNQRRARRDGQRKHPLKPQLKPASQQRGTNDQVARM